MMSFLLECPISIVHMVVCVLCIIKAVPHRHFIYTVPPFFLLLHLQYPCAVYSIDTHQNVQHVSGNTHCLKNPPDSERLLT